MSNRKQPDMKGNYSFEATFKMAWEGFICDFSPALMERIKGKVVIIGVDTLDGANARLELIVDGAFKAGILQHSDPRRMKIMIPGDPSDNHVRFGGSSL